MYGGSKKKAAPLGTGGRFAGLKKRLAMRKKEY